MNCENIMQAAQIHLVVATLIMTVTFTAGFTLLGGFDNDINSPNKGMGDSIKENSISCICCY
ncbi:hypothetical protein RDI58_014223 [Solanum bulbocastanum]|uniref:PGG domain-containing protein n=1 Tax=Solanum bulbocastanum TaxID=147425 RepID=A0AAN8YII4_SOLBU